MNALLVCRIGQLAGLAVLVGTATFRLLAGSAAGAGERRLWRGGLAAAGVFALGELWLTAAAMCDRTPVEALSSETLRTVLGLTSYGHIWVFRAAVWLGLAAWSWRLCGEQELTRQAERPPYQWITALVLAVLLLASHQGTSHAAASAQRAWLLPVNALHAVAAGVWPGALPSLAWWLAARRRADGWEETARVGRRFSRLALAAVGVLVLTGLLNSLGLVGTWAALASGGYGRMLLLKTGIFLGMAGLGATCRRQVPRLLAGEGAASAERVLRRGVLAECVLAALVLTATEMLAAGMPPCAACGR